MLNTKQLDNTITLRYITALSLIAILSTVAFYFLHSVLVNTNSTGYIVNISGKQRMLSQHIALDVHRIISMHDELKDVSNTNHLLSHQVLHEHTQEMLRANTILTTGHLPNQETIALSPTIYNMYFGEMNVSERVKNYVETAEKFLDTHEGEHIDALVKIIDGQSEPLLKDLNKIVQQYQLEGEEKLENIQRLEMITWMATIITLLLEIIFIFQPMSRKIHDLTSSNEHVLNNLENIVELRTRELETSNNKLSRLASHDPLTGLRNRLHLETDIEKAIKHYKSHHSPYAVLMLDIDWFKQVNDSYGHDAGDFVLVELSNILRSAIRAEDKIYRAGGEEFVLLLNRIEYTDSLNFAEKIRQLVQEHDFKTKTMAISKTISIGLYHSSLATAPDVQTTLKSIDNALYKSKTNGRNRVTIVDQEVDKEKSAVNSHSIDQTTIVFVDENLDDILEVHMTGHPLTCLNEKELLSDSVKFKSYVHPDDIKTLEKQIEDRKKPISTTIRLIDKETQVHIYKIKISRHSNNISINFIEVTSVASSVADSLLVKNFQAMLNQTDDYIYFKDTNHVFIAASESLVSLTSVNKREELIGKTDYQVFDKELADEYFKLERDVLDHKHVVSQERQPIIDKNGSKAWVDNRKYPITDEQGNIIGLFGIARVISDYVYQNEGTTAS